LRILFIYPNLNAQIGFNYGIAFLSAVLKQRGHETALINLNEKLDLPLDPGRIRNEIEAFQPDLIGFSIVTNQYKGARDVARTIREHVGVPMVAGGVHVTMDPQAVLADGLFDYACVGEGEGALAELADALEKGEPTDNIPNIWKCSGGEVVANPVRPFEDLADLPMKDYELFDFQKLIDAKDGWVGLMTSRGCIFRCSYCFNHRMVETYKRETGLSTSELRYTRHHPVDHVISEI
jgi:anaerobic magnesium-protoporphyrin IX monomethyl ester cyclase